ncbi:DNA damage-inducible protein 1 [Rhizophlyctis rosea]|uniref:DNA damage-inducible protein 1 n=1 Tax=Rhizophlyctis rosea TaxID=64517 RepID=A0AAD5S6E3_9FUNG|nr:DNA damage-inducible protein 1 [Rhizophlyctis rosea]
MRVHLTNDNGDVNHVDVDPGMELENLQALIEAETNIPVAQQQLFHNGTELRDGGRVLSSFGILQDDILLVRRNAASGQGQGPAQNAETVRQQILNDPNMLRQLSSQNPQLANAALNNPTEFARMYEQIDRHRRDLMDRQRASLAALEDADPFDIEAQRRIENEIRMQNVAQNMESAMEHHPESFGRVVMLYVNTLVNGHPVKAFVDSGAQATIMSPDCAAACNVMHLLDERFAGTAVGVGTAKILGRVHSAPLKIGNQFLACSFTIMEGKGVDLLFGLDMLKRHQACIDLEKNVLRINGEEVPFLAEHELPAKARWDGEQPAEGEEGPSGSTSTTTTHPEDPRTGIPSNVPGMATPPPAAAARSTPAGASNPPQVQSQSQHAEDKIKMLTDLGVSRQEAIGALDACGGNADVAANMLFNL